MLYGYNENCVCTVFTCGQEQIGMWKSKTSLISWEIRIVGDTRFCFSLISSIIILWHDYSSLKINPKLTLSQTTASKWNCFYRHRDEEFCDTVALSPALMDIGAELKVRVLGTILPRGTPGTGTENSQSLLRGSHLSVD